MKSDKIKRIVELFEKDDASNYINNDKICTRIEGKKVKDAFEIMMMRKGDTQTRKRLKMKRMRMCSTRKSDRLCKRK